MMELTKYADHDVMMTLHLDVNPVDDGIENKPVGLRDWCSAPSSSNKTNTVISSGTEVSGLGLYDLSATSVAMNLVFLLLYPEEKRIYILKSKPPPPIHNVEHQNEHLEDCGTKAKPPAPCYQCSGPSLRNNFNSVMIC